MLVELKALLHRYYITYLRFPNRPLNDFLLAIIIAATLTIRNISGLGILAGIIYFITLPFTFLTTVRTMLGEIVSEKASGIKEYLKLNGLHSFTYQLYLITLTSTKMLFFTCFVLVGIYAGTFFENDSPYNKFFSFFINTTTSETIQLYVLCSLATVSFILFLSTLFSDPKVASSVGGLLYAAISIISMIATSQNRVEIYYIVCLFPQSALTLAVKSGSRRNGMTTGLSLSTIMYMIVFDFFLYLILYMYLDQVVKDENGVRKPLLFFFDVFKGKKSGRRNTVTNSEVAMTQRLINPEEDESEGTDGNDEVSQNDSSSARFHEMIPGAHYLKKSVQINNLTKNFGKFTAVDNISFPIYQGQIFCLLGHNGAGKTTTIKMLTGLLEIDKGEVFYDGEDFAKNMEKARSKIGICTQHDILFEKLRVCEHLELVAKLRNLPDQEIPAAVEEALRKVNLVNERDKFSEELSGGNKRKLSLAMAVLGKTRVIFLDEPTSGMDPQNRRVMWYHLKQLKEQGLTILLTTHHLDEADELADRIAIMSKGRLLALGTSEFFKKKFGVGYHLHLTPTRHEGAALSEFAGKRQELQNSIQNIIPSAKFDEQTAGDVLKCSLPFATQKDFPRVFEELEKYEDIRVNVEMNTLEDVFVNIGLSEDKLLQGTEEDPENIEINVNTQPPACLSEKPVYNFAAQTFALAKRRVYLLTRSLRNIFLMVLPLVLILFGVLGSFGIEQTDFRFLYFISIVFFSFGLNTATYCSLPVYEREEKLKYLMDVMGLRNLPYWLGNISVDFIAITIINLIVYGLYYWFYSKLTIFGKILNMPTPTDFLIFMIPHGLALITIGYAYSFLFDKALSAVKIFPLIYFFGLNTLAMYAVSQVAGASENGISNPILAAATSIICPSSLMMLVFTGTLGREGSGFSIYKCAVAELCFAAFYFAITLALENRRLSSSKRELTSGWQAPEPQAIPVDHNDVQFETNRTMESQEDPIKAVGLSKIYDNGFTAVKGVTFGVPQGQIFGLLGPNGAGKSTTFNILTAATGKSGGSVQLLDQEVNKNMPEVYENVGICPQFNALWDFLTVKEHLMLFGNLKGLRGNKLDQVINYYLDVLQLRDHANKRAEDLSGGNKRKLSVANAFIGSAFLLFLDEPSTGVDPLARRFLWNSIQQVLSMRKASVVLTTHSMYEAESLSHKIGILINGRFVCIGPTQYLKEKNSHGYKVTVSLLPDAPDPMEKIMAIFPKAQRLNEASFVLQTYQIPFEGFKFSKAFDKLEVLKQQGLVKDFSIYNTTLEQIFIYFSKFQINLEDQQQNNGGVTSSSVN